MGRCQSRAFAAFFCRCIHATQRAFGEAEHLGSLGDGNAALEVLLTGFAEFRQLLAAMFHEHRMGLEPELCRG